MGASEENGANRRRHGRIRSKDLNTRLGEVQDLSASGLRLIGEVQPPENGSILHLDITHPEGSVRVKALVVWQSQIEDGRFEIGLSFEDVNPTTQAGIVKVARLAMSSISVDYSS